MAFALVAPAGAQQKKAPKPKPKPLDGAAIYARQCAKCHGAKGEGGPAFAKPLTGTRSIAELARFIHAEMPPGPNKTPTPDAERVAAYIHGAFYSPLAQERNRPARVALSRLTVRQFRNAVADLLAIPYPVMPAEAPGGLKGEYFKGRDRSEKARVFERVDPEVQFDFGTEGPRPNDFDPHNFSAVWQGSVLAPDTGEYEFIVRTDHAARLWVNGEKPLIDAWVKSGSDTEFRGAINLIAGRAYPLRLEFSKASQGVDDTEKKKGKPAPKAFVSLHWKRPKLAIETIPARNLFPNWMPNTYVTATPFPADDRSIGYERGSDVSKEWDDATTSAALEAAAYAADNLSRLANVGDGAPDRKAKAEAYARRFVERAFRRPITKDIDRLYIEKQFAAASTPEIAIKRVVLLTLKSPRFLYREVGSGAKDGYLVASQLSFGLWDSLPDAELMRAAVSGELATREGVTKQAERMAKDPRAWTKLREFLLHWLKVDEVPEIVKNTKRYPGFDAVTAADLRTSLELFLRSTAWSEASDYREILLSRTQFMNGRLAKIYGADLPESAPFQAVELDPKDRAGVLTHPYLLSRFAYLETSSPIHRGVLLARSMLGRNLQPPPAAFTPLAPSLHPSLTTRQRVALQTKPDACNSCHSMINPLGFTLERFDAIGRLRATENGKPIDATGSYRSRSGEVAKFAGATDLAKYLANSEEAHAAFVEKLFQHLVKQPVMAYGPQTLPNLKSSFAKNRYSIRNLMVQTMVATALADENRGPAKREGTTK
ncbi:MAG: DUF1592 domain-containing protein [Fimbriimonas sp.]